MAAPKSISDILGPPGAVPMGKPPAAAPDDDESDEGGEGELATHLRAMFKAERGGDMRAAEDAFRAAVQACSGSGYSTTEE